MSYNKISMQFIYILFISVWLFLFFPSPSFAAYPKLVSTIINAFETIKTWIIRIATPAAAVAARNGSVYAKVQFWR